MAASTKWADFSLIETALLERSRRVRVHQTGETIFRQGDEPQGIYCVESGYVLLWQTDPFGNETAFGVIGPGEIMGYRSLFAEDCHAATARALNSCSVSLHLRATIEQMLDANPALARSLLRTIARDRGPANALLLRGQHLPMRVRLMNLLIVLGDRFMSAHADGGMVIDLPLSRHDIAALMGARPETVTRTIRELEAEGIAKFTGRRVVIPDLPRMHETARLQERI